MRPLSPGLEEDTNTYKPLHTEHLAERDLYRLLAQLRATLEMVKTTKRQKSYTCGLLRIRNDKMSGSPETVTGWAPQAISFSTTCIAIFPQPLTTHLKSNSEG